MLKAQGLLIKVQEHQTLGSLFNLFHNYLFKPWCPQARPCGGLEKETSKLEGSLWFWGKEVQQYTQGRSSGPQGSWKRGASADGMEGCWSPRANGMMSLSMAKEHSSPCAFLLLPWNIYVGLRRQTLTLLSFYKTNFCHQQKLNIEIKCSFGKNKEVTFFKHWSLGPVTFIHTRLKISGIIPLFYAHGSITKPEHSDLGSHCKLSGLKLTHEINLFSVQHLEK